MKRDNFWASAGYSPHPTHQPRCAEGEILSRPAKAAPRAILPAGGARARIGGGRSGSGEVRGAVLENLHAGAIGAEAHHEPQPARYQATLIAASSSPWATASGCGRRQLPGIYEALREAAETMRRGWRRLRLLPHPAARCRGQRPPRRWRRADAATSACSTSLVPPWRARAPAEARRWGAAHRPPGRAGFHHRQAHARRLEQLQRVGGRERRFIQAVLR